MLFISEVAWHSVILNRHNIGVNGKGCQVVVVYMGTVMFQVFLKGHLISCLLLNTCKTFFGRFKGFLTVGFVVWYIIV